MTTSTLCPTRIGPTTFAWGERTFVMGILNVTPDSFSGDGLIQSGDPVAAALVIVPAIMVARLLPVTPGNVGLTSAAVAVALHERGVPMNSAVAAGIALHAVEMIVGVTFGAAGALSLAARGPGRSSRVRLRTWAGRTLVGAIHP